MSDEPITEAQIEAKFKEASQETDEFTLLHFGNRFRIPEKEEPLHEEEEWDFGDGTPGMIMSRLNPHGVFTPDGRQIGSTCGCEDYPCCGH